MNRDYKYTILNVIVSTKLAENAFYMSINLEIY